MTTAMIEAAVKRAGGRIVSAAGEGTESDDPASILMRRMIDAFAEYERLIIGFRTRSALAAKGARGERKGQVPYGRRLSGKGTPARRSGLPTGLEPDQAEAEVLELVGELARAAGRAAGLPGSSTVARSPPSGESPGNTPPFTTCSGDSPMAKRKKPPTISEQLREALEREDSLYELCAEARVSRSILTRFMRGERTITLETLDRLAEVLRLKLVR